MVKRFVLRALITLVAAATLGMAATTPALAYGQANWQLTFSGTAPAYGFWGWCDLAGATASSGGLAIQGSSGDCQFAEYFHAGNALGLPPGTCEVSFNLMAEGGQPAWQIEPSSFTGGLDWFFSGTQVIQPAKLTTTCERFPGVAPAATFSNFDSLLPVLVGHANLNGTGIFGTFELQITETPIP